MTANFINAAIATGERVTARVADLQRRGQPNPGTEIVVTRVWDDGRGGFRATAEGYRGRFRVTDLRGTSPLLDIQDRYAPGSGDLVW